MMKHKYPTVALALIAALGHLAPSHALAATASLTDQRGHVLVIFADGNNLATLVFGSDDGLTAASVNIMGDTDLSTEVTKYVSMQGFDLTGHDLSAAGDKTIDLLAVAYDDTKDIGQAAMILDALFNGDPEKLQSLNLLFADTASGVSTDIGHLANLATAPLGNVRKLAVA